MNSAIALFISCLLFPWFGQKWEMRTDIIHEGNTYASFTSLVYYKNSFYCAFREANNHVDDTGKDKGVIIVLKSRNCRVWNDFATFSLNNVDLRDPSLVITPDGNLMLLTFGVTYLNGVQQGGPTSYVSHLLKNEFTKLAPVSFDNNWKRGLIWKLNIIDDRFVGFTYWPSFALVVSEDGEHFNVMNRLNVDGNPNETDILKSGNEYIAILRRENANAIVGKSSKLDEGWEWCDAGCKVGGPDIIEIEGNVYVCGRSYKAGGPKTTLYILDRNTNSLCPIFDLPSGDDCSYPGMVYRRRKLYISHYHTDEKGGASIYLTIIKRKILK